MVFPFLLLVKIMDFDNERAYHSDDASQTDEVFGEDEREHAVDSEAAKWELSAVLWLAVALDVRQADYTWLST
jgi:hypothetical protein